MIRLPLLLSLFKNVRFLDTVSLFGVREIGREFEMKSMMALSPPSLFLLVFSRSLTRLSPPLIFCIENLGTKWSRGESDR